MEFLSPEGLRMDGRRPKELRKLHCEVGTLGEADGSATFDMGNTKVMLILVTRPRYYFCHELTAHMASKGQPCFGVG